MKKRDELMNLLGYFSTGNKGLKYKVLILKVSVVVA